MTLFWISLTIELLGIILFIVLLSKKKKFPAYITLVLDIFALALNYFSHYEEFPWTTYIFPFAQINYSANAYNEGKYYGGWEDEYPQGYGRLTYNHFVDEKYYWIEYDGQKYKALYYEGEFDHSWRFGHGIVVYEGGYRDEGEFFGKWEPGKIVFIGKRWHNNDKYVELEMVAINGIEAECNDGPEYWITIQPDNQ